MIDVARWFRRRPGYIYGITTIHEKSGRRVRGYVGKTWRFWRVRVAEHEIQPWYGLVVDAYVIKSKWFTPLGLWWAEVWRIVLTWPIYNYEWNRLNPRRIPKYVAAEKHRSPACRAALARRARTLRVQAAGVNATRDPFGQPAAPYRWGSDQRVG